MPQNASLFFLFSFSTNSRSSAQPKQTTQRHFFSPPSIPFPRYFLQLQQYLHLYCFVILFIFHCYTQREATPTQKLARKCAATSSRLLARKITKRIHSSKPASLNRPIESIQNQRQVSHIMFTADHIPFTCSKHTGSLACEGYFL